MVGLGLNLSLDCYGIFKKMKRPKLEHEASFGRFLTKIFNSVCLFCCDRNFAMYRVVKRNESFGA